MSVEIKAISETEYDDWYPLWQGYLTFYEASLPDEIAENNWRRFHDAREPIVALGAYLDGKLVGFMLKRAAVFITKQIIRQRLQVNVM